MLFDILNQRSHNDPNLQQGLEFMNFIKINNDTFNNDTINNDKFNTKQYANSNQDYTVGSIIESLEGIDSTNTSTAVNTDDNNNISDLEKQYQRTLSEYTKNYQLLMQNIIQSNKIKNKYSDYYGTIVSDTNGNYTYINDFGYTQKYSNNTWDSKDSSCPTSVNGSFDTSKLATGANMGVGQPCNLVGVNIRNTETDQKAWVDIKGYKHIYPDDVWEKKQNTCNILPIDVSSNIYISIPTSSDMQTATVCDKIGVDPVIWAKLMTLNDNLISIAKELSTEVSNIDLSSNPMSSQTSGTSTTAKSFNDQLKILENEKQKLKQLNIQLPTLISNYNDSKLEVKSSYYSYLTWLFGAIIVGVIAVKHL